VRAAIGRPYRWVRSWALWQAPPRVQRYVLAVGVVAAAVVVAAGFWMPVTATAGVRFAVLAGCAAAYIELTRTIERTREFRRGESSPYLDTKSVWSFASVLVLPPVLAMAMVAWTYAIAWWRIWPRQRPVALYRWTFSCATVLLGTGAAAVVIAVGLPHYPGVPSTTVLGGLLGLLVVAAAGAIRWLINAALVLAAILISTRHARAADVFDGFSEHLLEAGAMALGLVAATLVLVSPVMLAAIIVAMVALHRGVLVRQYQHAARHDPKTGLASAGWWHEQTEQMLVRARSRGEALGLLLFDLDHFKKINDTYGHLAGDTVLREVASALAGETRSSDLVGRWGGEEFVVAVTGVTTERALESIADRFRRRISSLAVDIGCGDDPQTVTDLTISVGGTIYYPDSAISAVDEILLIADTQLYRAKSAGRDRTSIASPEPSARQT
jgi:diguanylate cyclase (GGDEF)-like protein